MGEVGDDRLFGNITFTRKCGLRMRITALLLLVSAVSSLPLSEEPSKAVADVSDQVGELEQKIEELLDNSDMTPEELADLLNEDIASEEVEYIVEAVDEGLVVSLQEKQALFYPDLDYTEDSSEEVDAESEEQKEEGDDDEEEDEEGEGGPLELQVEDHAAEEDELVEYDYTLLETSDSMIVVLDADAASSEELDYVVQEDARSKMEEKLFLEVEFDEAVKYDHFNDDRKIFEIVIMSGIAMTCLMFIFGLAALISSYLAPQTPPTVTIAALPKPPQMTSSSGGIIRQYTRVPVEIKNMLPSNVAYKQLYET